VLKHVPRLQQLEDEAVMAAKVELVEQPDYVMLVPRVLLHEVPEELGFTLGEFVVQLRVSRNLDGHHLSGLVISSGDDLGKAPLAQDLEDLEAVKKLLALSNQIVAFLVVVFGIRLLGLIEAIVRGAWSEASRVEVHDVRQLLSLHLL
jgi:hypothetical protein